MTLQTPLIRSDARRCVLATIEDARRQLKDWLIGSDRNVNEDTILELIESGALPWAWNIAADPRDAKRLWRILPECLDHFDRTGGKDAFGWSQAKVLARITEGHGDSLSVRNIADILVCGPTHVANLIQAGALRSQRNDYGITKISKAQFLSFLTSRAEGAS